MFAALYIHMLCGSGFTVSRVCHRLPSINRNQWSISWLNHRANTRQRTNTLSTDTESERQTHRRHNREGTQAHITSHPQTQLIELERQARRQQRRVDCRYRHMFVLKIRTVDTMWVKCICVSACSVRSPKWPAVPNTEYQILNVSAISISTIVETVKAPNKC